MLTRNVLIWFLVSLFYAYQYILRVIPNIITFQLIEKFNINVKDIGQFSSLYYVGYALAHIPVGIFLDRFGPKIVLPICIVLTFTGTLPLICSDIWYYSALGRIIVGIGSSASAIGIFKISNMYFSVEKSVMMTSLSIIIGILGAIFGSGQPLDYLLNTFGLDYVMYVFVLFGCLLAILLFLITPRTERSQSKISMKDFNAVFFNKHIILISVLSGLMIGPLQGFADKWTKIFLCEIYGFSETLSSSFTSLIFIGLGVGSFFSAYVLKKYPNKHYDIIIISAFTMIISFLLLFTGSGGIYLVLLTLFVIGLGSCYQVVTIYKAISYVNANLVGLATAISNMILMGFSCFFHSSTAKIISLYSNKTIMQGSQIYGSDVLIKAISIIPICLLIAALGFIWLKKMDKRKAL
ncbi:permease [Wolbachia pipientis]|uniref:Permease n=1 Tax=Wolbachia pipientis TaxID=955 RepID=A0A1E7QIY0_WOLPI|nr:MFS transporter [Wolbachia pipientis]OEY86428.1 permease [Wolbachia pipientis]